jgi:hypothetical protein
MLKMNKNIIAMLVARTLKKKGWNLPHESSYEDEKVEHEEKPKMKEPNIEKGNCNKTLASFKIEVKIQIHPYSCEIDALKLNHCPNSHKFILVCTSKWSTNKGDCSKNVEWSIKKGDCNKMLAPLKVEVKITIKPYACEMDALKLNHCLKCGKFIFVYMK